MQILEVGKPFKLFAGRNLTGQDGCILEKITDGSYALMVYMNKMSDKEKELLRFSKIYCKIIEEANYLLTLICFGNTPLCFEISFDPTLYKDNRMDNLLKSNMLNLIGVESSDNIIKTLRTVNIPKRLYQKMIVVWTNAKEIKNYSQKYTRWQDDLDSRYTLLDLWDMGIYMGKMGE